MKAFSIVPPTLYALVLSAVPSLAAEAEWKLEFQDDFERTEIGDQWSVSGKGKVMDGALLLEGVSQATINRGFKPDVRLEFDARSLPGVPPCDLSATLACGDLMQYGYLLGFGARGNTANHLVGPGAGWADLKPPFPIEREKLYHLVARMEGKRITYTVNGTDIIDRTVEDPLGGPSFDRVGLLTWTGMTVDNVRVYERATPHPDTPRVLGKLPDGPLYREGRKLHIRPGNDAPALKAGVEAFNRGDPDAALEAFRSLGNTFAGLLGQAYVYGDLNFIEPVNHTYFTDLGSAFAKLSAAQPDNSAIADYALATEWLGRLVMQRDRTGRVAAIRILALGLENNPFYHKSLLYQARYKYGDGQEGGAPRVVQEARDEMKKLMEIWPDNRILRQFTGEKIPWGDEYLADTEKHPAWAAYLREAYARDIAIMERFVETRQREDGQFGGGYGDDVEMMRTWMQIAAISSAAKTARAGIERLCEGVWNNVLLNGYDKGLGDVEHSSEPSADTVPGMLLVRHGDPLWVERNLQSCHTIKNYFMGMDPNGYPRFKSSWFGAMQVGDESFGGGDTGYCGRPMKHFLWAAWQGNPDAKDWFVGWADGWRNATVREIDGKIAGIPPLSIWYSTGGITPPFDEHTWYSREANHWAHQPMTEDAILAAYWLTEDPKFLVPFNLAMQIASRGPLPRDPQPGSPEWQMLSISHLPNNMPMEQTKVGLYRWLTGDRAYEEYTWRTADPSLKFMMNGDLDAYQRTFEGAARHARYNIDMMTTEVMAMDRAGVPAALAIFGAYTGAISGMRDVATPTFAVTYDTPTTDFAALVMHASRERLRIWMYNFDEQPMPIGLKLWRLRPGRYILEQGEQMKGEAAWQHRYAWIEPREIEVIHHGGGPTVMVPPGKVWAVDLRLKEPIALPERAPDLAIGGRDISTTTDGVNVTVHNIGDGDAKRFAVAVEAPEGGAWRQVARKEVPGLAAPRDLVASSTEIMVPVKPAALPAGSQVRLMLVEDRYERYEGNNIQLLDKP